jgi:hypothetical protein
MRNDIFWPMIAQVALTFVVWLRMYVQRIGEMKAMRIHPQAIATSAAAAEKLRNTTAADNFRNLFEVPVLFYAICLALALTDRVTRVQLVLAWAFVVLRIAHSFIQITYNKVKHRFYIYVLGATCVFAMWAVFAVSLGFSVNE